MRILIFVIAIVVKAKCYQIPEVTTSQYSVPIIHTMRNTKETFVYFKDNDYFDVLFFNSLILDLYSDQSVILTNNDIFFDVKRHLVHKDSNVVIMIEALNIKDLHSRQFNAIFYSSWATINIILTAKSGSQTCENETVSEAFLENAEHYMNIIWHRYQIITVVISFPYTCPQQFMLYSGKKPSFVGALYDRTLKMVTAKNKKELKATVSEHNKIRQLTEEYPLRVSIFYRFPTTITECNDNEQYIKWNFSYSNGYCGLDGLLLHDFVDHYRYRLLIANDKRCDKYGYLEPHTHNATGSLGCVIRGEADISFNSRFQVQYTTAQYFYLHYITVDSLCVALRRPGIISLWHYAYNTYNAATGSLLLLMILAVGALTWTSAYITKGITGKRPQKLHTYIFNSLTCTLFGFPIEKKSERFRILRGTSLFCSIILLAFYQGNVNYQFTTRTRYKEIKTLRQLYLSANTLYTSPSLLDLLKSTGNPSDEAQVAYIRRAQLKNETLGLEFVFDNQETATLSRREDIQIEVLLNFTDDNGTPLIYVVDECFHVYYLSYIARNGFLFTDETRIFMMRMLEAGLPNKYYVWTRRKLKLGGIYSKSETEPRPFGKKKLSDLRVPFGILAFGYGMSICIFVVEMYKGKRRRKYVHTVRHNT